MTSNKVLVFDMDGTIANLYGVENWLEALRASNPSPYIEADPMYDMDLLQGVLNGLRLCGWRVVVTSWLSMGSTKEYDRAVRNAKLDWLDRYHFPYDEVHLVKYGTTKANCTRSLGGFQILFDDNEQVRRGWSLGETVDANENIMDFLFELLELELA